MPIINLKISIENEQERGSYKHLLNHEDFEIWSAKEDETSFSMIAIKRSSKQPNDLSETECPKCGALNPKRNSSSQIQCENCGFNEE